MTPVELERLLQKYFNGGCTPEEIKFIHTWYESIGSEHDYQLDGSEREKIESRLWSGIDAAVQHEKHNHLSGKSYSIKHNWTMRIAAAIALFIGIGACFYLLFLQRSPDKKHELALEHRAHFTEFVNTKNEPVQYTLEDGSKVTLQPLSKLRFTKFHKEKREVSLTGEGFFDIVRNPERPFYVYAKDVVTKVLGTSFTIKAYQKTKEVNVLVRTGRVSVSSQPHDKHLAKRMQEVILTPNQEAIYTMDDELLRKKLVDKPILVLEKPTLFEMEYDGVPVVKIFNALKDNYGVDIAFDSEKLSACILTTSLADEGLYERIEIICKAIGAHYKIVDAVIVIESDGCQ